MEKLTAQNLKNELWETLHQVKNGKMDCGQADSVASQAREILRTVKTQLQITHMAKRDVPAELIVFNED